MKYNEWRRQLHELQQAFEKFDDEWDYTSHTYEEFTTARQIWVDKLEAHYQLEATTV